MNDTANTSPRQEAVTMTCAACGGPASTVTDMGPTNQPGVHSLTVAGNTGFTTLFHEAALVHQIIAALREGDLQAIPPRYWLELDCVCRECGAAYCRGCWSDFMDEFDPD
ncbi:MAG: hypothetical protein Q9Q40_04675, partial [Acidobacteriota bacterium]|nr:hypothetical protein [Acidobacteriota bacterium]